MFPSDTDFESQFTFENSVSTPLPDEPAFHILLLGDWSGEAVKKDLSERRPIVIDLDNYDEVIRRFNPKLSLDLQGEILSLEFAELDDFHPDNLFRQVPLFTDLRDIRRRLSNSDTFDDAAREVRSWFDFSSENVPTEAEAQTEIEDAPPIESGNLLDMILTRPAESSVRPQKTDNSELGRFVSKIVAPHLVKIDENEQSKLIAAVDEAISGLMRIILHQPRFQTLESAWRGLYFLVRRVETDTDLKIFILDVSKDELSDNLKTVSSLTDSFLYRRLILEATELPGNTAFSFIGGNYTFRVNVDDVATLMRIAKIVAAAESPFISHIFPQMFGAESFSDNFDFSECMFPEDSTEGKLWTALRSIPEADFLGLSPSRFLARMPYGESADSTETFSFEEFAGALKHENYLWINPCFACALLLARSFRQYGWQMGESLLRDIEKLPLYIYREDGETKTKPCAEILLTENQLEEMLEQGLMPLVTFRNSDQIKLAKFQSISSSRRNLSGRWSL